MCSLGSCVPSGDAGSCAGGLLLCSGACVDGASDPQNCGACGKKCSTGEACSRGSCLLRCGAGSVRCGDECVEPNADARYCGATVGCGTNGLGSAGVRCPDGTSCLGGQCLGDCENGTAFCKGSCIDITQNSANCGGCGNACAAGKVCTQRICCPMGFVGCMGVCRDLLSDEEACGACGVQCPSTMLCVNGACQ